VAELILVRHGRTEWNRVERFRGRADIALDEIGIAQAKAVAGRISGIPVSAVYSSPLRRAMTTAEAIAEKCGLVVNPLDGIVDIDYGDWQGLSPEEASQKDSELHRRWMESPHLVEFPGGEDLEKVRMRASASVEALSQQLSGETIVLVSHKVVCQILILHFLGLDNSHFWQIGQDVCALNVFQVTNNGTYALQLNDTCHLNELQAK
jgi:broad specificity phosphatase PhoE